MPHPQVIETLALRNFRRPMPLYNYRGGNFPDDPRAYVFVLLDDMGPKQVKPDGKPIIENAYRIAREQKRRNWPRIIFYLFKDNLHSASENEATAFFESNGADIKKNWSSPTLME